MTSIPYYSFAGSLLLGCFLALDYPWFFIAFIYAIVPLLDEIFSHDYCNPDDEERK